MSGKIKFKNFKLILSFFSLIFLLIIVSILSLSKGTVLIPTKDIWMAIFQKGEELNQTIIWELRLPRLIASLLVGSSLGMSGALLQGMLRNGLASPYLLGISAGSGLVIVVFLTFGIAQIFIPIAAWSGAIITTLLVFILAIGYYITPALVGGASGTLISNQIAYHMKATLDWSFASAMGLMLLTGVLVVYWIYNKLVGIDNIKLG